MRILYSIRFSFATHMPEIGRIKDILFRHNKKAKSVGGDFAFLRLVQLFIFEENSETILYGELIGISSMLRIMFSVLFDNICTLQRLKFVLER